MTECKVPMHLSTAMTCEIIGWLKTNCGTRYMWVHIDKVMIEDDINATAFKLRFHLV